MDVQEYGEDFPLFLDHSRPMIISATIAFDPTPSVQMPSPTPPPMSMTLAK